MAAAATEAGEAAGPEAAGSRAVLRALLDPRRDGRIRREVAAAELHSVPEASSSFAHAALLRRVADAQEGFAAQRCVPRLLQLVALESAGKGRGPAGDAGLDGDGAASAKKAKGAPLHSEWGREGDKLLYGTVVCLGRWGELRALARTARRDEERAAEALEGAHAAAVETSQSLQKLLERFDKRRSAGGGGGGGETAAATTTAESILEV